jgi:CDP-diglyceride synthetase
MKEIHIRALSGSLYASVIVGAIFLSPLAICIVILVFSVLALWEFQRLVQFKSVLPITILLLLTGYGYFGYTTKFNDGIIVHISIAINLYLLVLLFVSKKIQLSC